MRPELSGFFLFIDGKEVFLITSIRTVSHWFNLKVTARAGNIIGGGDWAKDRIVTDIVESIEQKRDIVLRSPNAIRPWQHVIDVVNGYLKLATAISLSSSQNRLTDSSNCQTAVSCNFTTQAGFSD